MNIRFLLLFLLSIVGIQTYVSAAEVGPTYAVNAQLAKHKAVKGTCLTSRDFPASDKNRELAYKLLQRSGHPKPEIVILASNPAYSTCAGLFKLHDLEKAPVLHDSSVVTINIDEREQTALERIEKTKWFAHGAFVCTLGHEIGHLMFRHYRVKLGRADLAAHQQLEIECDLHGVQVSHCYQCAYNFIESWLYDSRHSPVEQAELKRTPYANMSIKDLLAMSKIELETHIEATSKISRNPALKRSHPLHIERALRLCYFIHFEQPMNPRYLCSYHKKQLPEKLKHHHPMSKAEHIVHEQAQRDLKMQHADDARRAQERADAKLAQHLADKEARERSDAALARRLAHEEEADHKHAAHKRAQEDADAKLARQLQDQ